MLPLAGWWQSLCCQESSSTGGTESRPAATRQDFHKWRAQGRGATGASTPIPWPLHIMLAPIAGGRAGRLPRCPAPPWSHPAGGLAGFLGRHHVRVVVSMVTGNGALHTCLGRRVGAKGLERAQLTVGSRAVAAAGAMVAAVHVVMRGRRQSVTGCLVTSPACQICRGMTGGDRGFLRRMRMVCTGCRDALGTTPVMDRRHQILACTQPCSGAGARAGSDRFTEDQLQGRVHSCGCLCHLLGCCQQGRTAGVDHIRWLPSGSCTTARVPLQQGYGLLTLSTYPPDTAACVATVPNADQGYMIHVVCHAACGVCCMLTAMRMPEQRRANQLPCSGPSHHLAPDG